MKFASVVRVGTLQSLFDVVLLSILCIRYESHSDFPISLQLWLMYCYVCAANIDSVIRL